MDVFREAEAMRCEQDLSRIFYHRANAIGEEARVTAEFLWNGHYRYWFEYLGLDGSGYSAVFAVTR